MAEWHKGTAAVIPYIEGPKTVGYIKSSVRGWRAFLFNRKNNPLYLATFYEINDAKRCVEREYNARYN